MKTCGAENPNTYPRILWESNAIRADVISEMMTGGLSDGHSEDRHRLVAAGTSKLGLVEGTFNRTYSAHDSGLVESDTAGGQARQRQDVSLPIMRFPLPPLPRRPLQTWCLKAMAYEFTFIPFEVSSGR
jgi:hypothetical protein